jgi:hypothetical protein
MKVPKKSCFIHVAVPGNGLSDLLYDPSDSLQLLHQFISNWRSDHRPKLAYFGKERKIFPDDLRIKVAKLASNLVKWRRSQILARLVGSTKYVWRAGRIHYHLFCVVDVVCDIYEEALKEAGGNPGVISEIALLRVPEAFALIFDSSHLPPTDAIGKSAGC